MNPNDILQIGLYLGVLLVLVKPLGSYMANVYTGKWQLAPERWIYRLSGLANPTGMDWKSYAGAFLVSNAIGFLFVYVVLRLQPFLPWNPEGMGAVNPDTAFNIAVSFATNTNWQNYGGEATLSYFSQMLGLTAQNFLSAASGMAVLVALARGICGRNAKEIGNYWVDLVRGVIYILMPLSMVLALLLVSEGVIQNLSSYVPIASSEQIIPMGPVASQIAIKQLGTNGGGFFNTNSAHPLENPTAFTNFVECLAILLIPASLCYTFGKLVNDRRQGWAVLASMLLLFIPLVFVSAYAEQGNMEGKELRIGTANSALWAVATTAASNGSVNSMHDSYTPLGSLPTMFLMQVGEVVFGGVGSGLYGMIVFAIITVFLAGLMVGRTPEYLGKKVEAFEMKMASIAILVPSFTILAGTAIAVVTPMGIGGLTNHGPHGFSEILYAFSSMGGNNGSAFAGYGVDNPLVNYMGGIVMLLGRYWVALPVIAIAGSLAAKKTVPVGPGTLATHTPLFVVLLAGAVVIVGALAFIPALALGPIVEALL